MFFAPDGRLVRWNQVTGRKDQLRVLDETQGLVCAGDGTRLMLPVANTMVCRTCAKYGRPTREDAERRLAELAPARKLWTSCSEVCSARVRPDAGATPVRTVAMSPVGRHVCESLCAVCSENLTTQPHLTVVQNQIRRRDFDVVRVGGRVPYVFVVTEEEKAYRSAEHPSRVDDASRVDWHYYLENQIRKPILRLVEYMPGVQTIVERMNGLAAELKGRRGKRLRGTLNLRDFATAAAATTAESTTTRRNVKKKTPPSVRRKRQLPAPKSNVEMRRTRKKRLQDGPRNGLRRFVSK